MSKSANETSGFTAVKAALVAFVFAVSGAVASAATHRSADLFSAIALALFLYIAVSITRSNGSNGGGGHRVETPDNGFLARIPVEMMTPEQERRALIEEARRRREV